MLATIISNSYNSFFYPIIGIRSANGVPDTSQPMCYQHIEAEQQNQHSSTIFQISVQFSDNSSQSQKSDYFQGTEQRTYTLLSGNNVLSRFCNYNYLETLVGDYVELGYIRSNNKYLDFCTFVRICIVSSGD